MSMGSSAHPSVNPALLEELVRNLAEVIESGPRDQHADALINELTNQFDKCQQLSNSISASLPVKNMTVEGQKQKLEETEQLLNQRRDLISKYRSSVQQILGSDGADKPMHLLP